MKCKYCFSVIPDNSTFCRYCGSILDSSASNRVQTVASGKGQVAAPVKKHRLRKFLLFLIFSFLVLSLVAYALIFIFFPPGRHYQSEVTVKEGDSETVSVTNHRGFLTKHSENGETDFEVIFRDDGRIAKFILGEEEEILFSDYSESSSGSQVFSSYKDYTVTLSYNKQKNPVSFTIQDDAYNVPVSAAMQYNSFGIMTNCEIIVQNKRQVKLFD